MARIKGIETLRLSDMEQNLDLYAGLSDGLIQLDCPDVISIWYVNYKIPEVVEELTKNICYGQRLYLARDEEDDIGLMQRIVSGFYYPIIKKTKWDEEKALLFQKKVLTCKVKEIYPVTMHLVNLISEMAEAEKKLLHREPSKMERAAGIDKLTVFSELNSLDFLRDAMKITVEEVLLTPYEECLVRYLNAKELADFNERYFKLLKEEKPDKKSKYK